MPGQLDDPSWIRRPRAPRRTPRTARADALGGRIWERSRRSVLFTADSAAPPKAWLDVGLSVLVLAATLQLWRAPEEGLPDALRFRELHRRVCWRVSTVLLLSGTLALAADRRLGWEHDRGDAHTVSVLGVALIRLCALPRLLDPLLWRVWPAPLRQAAQAAEVLGKISRTSPAYRNRLTTGLPEPILRRPGGKPSPEACSTYGRKRRKPHQARLRWDGRHLLINDLYGTTVPVPIDGRPGEASRFHDSKLRPTAAMVWIKHNRSPYDSSGAKLLLLDAQGRRCVELAEPHFNQDGAMQVARAAGIPFTAYDFCFAATACDELIDALFPNSGQVMQVVG